MKNRMSIAIPILSAAQILALAAVHVANPSMHFAREQLSLYTNGRWGGLVPAASLCFAVTLGLTALYLRPKYAAKTLTTLVTTASLLFLLAGIFRVDGSEFSRTAHNATAILGMVALLVAMGVAWGKVGRISLALCVGGLLCFGGGVFFPTMAGLFQKLLMLDFIVWVNWTVYARQ